jgi:hypothetical protein
MDTERGQINLFKTINNFDNEIYRSTMDELVNGMVPLVMKV